MADPFDTFAARHALQLPEDWSWPDFEPGSVWLAGAGPGDPGLLTLHAVRALAQADAVVYDALVDPRILGTARSDALKEYSGKRGGKPSAKQRDISARLVQLARRGLKVLRLKGGDPFVFGRGAEEALALVAAKIPFRVIPGVTAGIGGLAYAGIPVTHRDTNHAVTFITGHSAGGAMPDGLNWDALAQGSPVIVLYMALKHLPGIAQRFVAAGRPANEPVAIVSHATLPQQNVHVTSLSACAEGAFPPEVEAPAITVFGEVVRLREGVDWLGALLEGRQLDADPLGRYVTLASA